MNADQAVSVSARTKCEFARYLDDAPFPAELPPDLLPRTRKQTSKRFGNWLREHNYPVFIQRYEAWRSAP
jgi:hypothetical protein